MRITVHHHRPTSGKHIFVFVTNLQRFIRDLEARGVSAVWVWTKDGALCAAYQEG